MKSGHFVLSGIFVGLFANHLRAKYAKFGCSLQAVGDRICNTLALALPNILFNNSWSNCGRFRIKILTGAIRAIRDTPGVEVNKKVIDGQSLSNEGHHFIRYLSQHLGVIYKFGNNSKCKIMTLCTFRDICRLFLWTISGQNTQSLVVLCRLWVIKYIIHWYWLFPTYHLTIPNLFVALLD